MLTIAILVLCCAAIGFPLNIIVAAIHAAELSNER